VVPINAKSDHTKSVTGYFLNPTSWPEIALVIPWCFRARYRIIAKIHQPLVSYGAGCRTRTRDPLITKIGTRIRQSPKCFNYRALGFSRDHGLSGNDVKIRILRASCAPVSYAFVRMAGHFDDRKHLFFAAISGAH